MNNRENVYTEVYTILQELDEEEYNKIPPEVTQTIEANRNEDYEYELDEELELKDQPMLPETKAILFNLFRDYLATPEQKAKIIRMQNEARQKNELKKRQLYDVNVFANKEKEQNDSVTQAKQEKLLKKGAQDTQVTDKNMQIIEYKENIFKKILDKIRNFFRLK